MRTPLLSPNRRVRPRSEPRARTQAGDNLLGAALMVASMAVFTLNDTAMKYVTATLPLSEAMFLRGAAITLVLGLMAQRDGGVMWWPSVPRDRWMLGGRAVTEASSTVIYLVALQNMALGELSAIMQSLPLAVMLAAAVIFREPMGWRRMLAVAVGFLGVMLILRPGTARFDIWAGLAVLTVLLIVVRDLTTRAMTREVRSSTVAFSAALVVTLSAFAAPSQGPWRMPSGDEAMWLAGSAFFLTAGYLSAVATMRVGDIGFVTPFRYTSLLFAVLLGFLVFDEWPDLWTWTGSALIVSAGLYSIWRETRLRVSQ